MSRLVGARSLIGRPVVTLGGDFVGEVKDVVFSAGSAALLGFTLNGRGLLADPLKEGAPRSAIHAVGSHAVMITGRDGLEPIENVLAGAAPIDRDVVGNRVLTTDGRDVGQVTDVIIEVGGTAEVAGYEIEPDEGLSYGPRPIYVALKDTVAVSGETLVIPPTPVDDFGARLEPGDR